MKVQYDERLVPDIKNINLVIQHVKIVSSLNL